jgi:hypothetical protein
MMESQEKWNQFEKTGCVADYMAYREAICHACRNAVCHAAVTQKFGDSFQGKETLYAENRTGEQNDRTDRSDRNGADGITGERVR